MWKNAVLSIQKIRTSFDEGKIAVPCFTEDDKQALDGRHEYRAAVQMVQFSNVLPLRMKENIKIVTAGAGSGKTYRLATEVLQAIQQKAARPEGILLTTFTRKAAAELEERVRVRLLEQGAWEEAQRIRQAWIGTIDSVCLRIIQEYAFEAGQSPEIAVFGAGEDLIEFNRALSDSVTDEELEQLESLSKSLVD